MSRSTLIIKYWIIEEEMMAETQKVVTKEDSIGSIIVRKGIEAKKIIDKALCDGESVCCPKVSLTLGFATINLGKGSAVLDNLLQDLNALRDIVKKPPLHEGLNTALKWPFLLSDQLQLILFLYEGFHCPPTAVLETIKCLNDACNLGVAGGLERRIKDLIKTLKIQRQNYLCEIGSTTA